MSLRTRGDLVRTGISFHECGITVAASMGTTYIGINTVINTRDPRSGEDRFNLYFLDD